MPTGCSFHPRCPVAFEECERVDPPLLHIGDRDAACLRVTGESVAAGTSGTGSTGAGSAA